MNIRIAKAFGTTSSEALCILAGTTPIVIIINTEEVVKQYNIRKGKGSQTQLIDRELELKNWSHLADAVKIIEAKGYQDQTIQAYTDGSKNKHGVGYGVAIFFGKELAVQLKFKVGNKCSNNQAEQLAIFKALEVMDTIEITENSPRTATIFTDSRISIDSLKNVNNHSYLIEETRKNMSTLERENWTIEFLWVNAHVVIYGNELADQLAKAAARNRDTTNAFERIPLSRLYSEIEEEEEEEAKEKWQKEWKDCTKAAISKQYFPNVKDRIKLQIDIKLIFTALVTGHG